MKQKLEQHGYGVQKRAVLVCGCQLHIQLFVKPCRDLRIVHVHAFLDLSSITHYSHLFFSYLAFSPFLYLTYL
jgi:hypothetical protein